MGSCPISLALPSSSVLCEPASFCCSLIALYRCYLFLHGLFLHSKQTSGRRSKKQSSCEVITGSLEGKGTQVLPWLHFPPKLPGFSVNLQHFFKILLALFKLQRMNTLTHLMRFKTTHFLQASLHVLSNTDVTSCLFLGPLAPIFQRGS